MADAEPRCVRGDGDEQHCCGCRRRGDGRRQAVHDAGAFDVDGALAPEPPQLAVRLERRRAAPALEARLPVLHEAGEERREQEPAGELHRDGESAHPISPALTAASRTTTSAIR